MKTKWILFKFLPFEYEALEKYLEDMALKGWMLEKINGGYIKFKKMEPKKIKYSIDVLNKVSFFDGKNSDNALEYREYCVAAGWQFVCEWEKFQVFSCAQDIEKVPIHTDEKEKFKSILKASLYYISASLIMVICFGIMAYIATIGSFNANFLASNTSLMMLIMQLSFISIELMGVISFVLWIAKGTISLKKGDEVSYNHFKFIKIKRVINNLIFFIAIFILLCLLFEGQTSVLGIVGSILIMIGIFILLMKYVSKTNYKATKKRTINIGIYILMTISTLVIMNLFIFRGISFYENSDDKIDFKLTLEDFGDTTKDEGYTSVDESIIARTIEYQPDGEKYNLGYELFESEYEWANKYQFNKMIKANKEMEIEYIEKDTNLPSNIKVLRNENGHIYLMASPDKVVEFFDWDEVLDEEVVINTVYENLFK